MRNIIAGIYIYAYTIILINMKYEIFKIAFYIFQIILAMDTKME